MTPDPLEWIVSGWALLWGSIAAGAAVVAVVVGVSAWLVHYAQARRVRP